MAAVPSKCLLRIERNRHWEDYKSLKKFWSHSAKFLREYIFDGYETTTATATEMKDGSDATIAFLSANDIVYIRSELDLAALDGDSIWMDYVSSTGILYENIESKLDSETATTVEVPIGCESGTFVDTVESIAGNALTMTALDMSAYPANYLAGWYVVASGDATHMEGSYLTILSNTAANPTVITCTTTPHANWDDDNVSIQRTLNNDVFRIRRIWAETESPEDNAQIVCDKDKTNIYAIIPDGNSRSNHPRYFALSSTYRCFLGMVKASFPIQNEAGDAKEDGAAVTVIFTPKIETGQAKCDITLQLNFADTLDWQPCIELEPCTDVTFKIHKLTNVNHVALHLEYKILEVNTT